MQTLDLVAREINHSLNEARNALETYVEQQENVTLLERCSADLHQIQGVLRVLEIYGAALLAEEMEHVSCYLLSASARKNQAEALDALMRAMVQLPGYLERVLAGGRDLALVLLPLLNDLRAVRQPPAFGRHTAAAQSQIGQTGGASGRRRRRRVLFCCAMGAQAARAVSGRTDRLDTRRAYRAEP